MSKDLRVSKSGKIIEVVEEKKTEVRARVVGYTDNYTGEKQKLPSNLHWFAKYAFTELK